jgi:acetyl-CoA carboxylase alpha subunit
VGDAVEAALVPLLALNPEQLRQQRADRFYAIGQTERG